MKRKIYLKMKSLVEARELWLNRFEGRDLLGEEEISVLDALGRITSHPVFAGISSPPFHAAAMDGVAVLAERTYGAQERTPKKLKLNRDAFWINTGRPIPEGTNAVIMVERLRELEDEFIEIYTAAYPWENVRRVGEDVVATELLFPRNHRIRSYDLGALLAADVDRVLVRKLPGVTIIPTGNELLGPIGKRTENVGAEGKIPESNSVILSAMVREYGGIPRIEPIVGDVYEDLLEAVRTAVESDDHMVIINAGSSAGSEDYTYHVLEALGEVLVHGVAMMPGKPTILAEISGKPVIGNPGYSVSATLSFDQFGGPLLCAMQGVPERTRKRVRVHMSRAVPSKLGVEEFLRVNLGRVNDRIVATPLPRGAGSITTLTRAEGMVRLSELSEGLPRDAEADAELLVEDTVLDRTLVMIGSHDMSIDVLADLMKRDPRGFRLSSANVGSLGGLLALRSGCAHAAGSHLLEEETGEYNRFYVKKYLPGMRVSLFHLVRREQGLILRKGNPKSIRGLEDLARDDVTFMNRQTGSGTRILLDFRLKQQGIDPTAIRGYDREEYTHMAVAVDVKSGVSDVGLGIFAAARALDLEFIPVVQEQYDLVIPSAFLEDERVRMLLDTASTQPFRERMFSLGGYDPGRSGEFWTEIGP